jgi:hypothetical protein
MVEKKLNQMTADEPAGSAHHDLFSCKFHNPNSSPAFVNKGRFDRCKWIQQCTHSLLANLMRWRLGSVTERLS